MKRQILSCLALGLLLSCDKSTNTINESESIRLSPRVQRNASVTDSIWNLAATVHVRLTTTNGTPLLNDTVAFSKHTSPVVAAPSDQGVSVLIEGLSNSNVVVWSGNLTLPPSTRDTAFAVTVDAVTNPGGSNGGPSLGTVNTPSFDSIDVKSWASADTFDQPVHVYLSSMTPGAVLHYTLDGSYPTTSSPVYGNAGVLIDSSRTMKVIATKVGWTSSASFTQSFVLQARPVTFAANGNVGWPPFKIGLSCPTAGVVIRYTTDATLPTTGSPVYSDSLTFVGPDSLTYQAIAVDTLHPKVASAISSQRFGVIAPWTKGITYGSVSDAAGRSYKTVKIDTQWWMAENLNYAGSGTTIGMCYNNSPESCAKYGRLYTWSEVMAGASSSTLSPSGVQGICPTGWHVPSDTEWTTMLTVVGAANATDGTKLKSTSGWVPNGTNSGNGTDDYGFRALPGGNFIDTTFFGAGSGFWWSATEHDYFSVWYRSMGNDAYVYHNVNAKAFGLSLRCAKD